MFFEPKKIKVGEVEFGGNETVVIAGPCAVESYGQLDRTAGFLSKKGIKLLRTGLFKPRTHPDSFKGLGVKGFEITDEIRKKHKMLNVSEVMEPSMLAVIAEHSDIIQIGARSMRNYPLLTEAGKSKVPVILKRGICATVDEWLAAAEYIAREGNDRIIMCERGIRTFETSTRFTLDISSIPLLKQRSGYPVIVDPSHAAGNSDLVIPLSLAGLAAGADGLMLEVHPAPESALSDGKQSLSFNQFERFIDKISVLSKALGKKL